MKKIIIACVLTFIGLGLMAAPESVEKTIKGKLTEVSKEVKGKQITAYYLVDGKKKIKLPKAQEGIDLSSLKDKNVTVVIKGINKTKVNKKTKKETTRFLPKEIVSIEENAEENAEESEE